MKEDDEKDYKQELTTMKQFRSWMFTAILIFCGVWARAQAVIAYPDPFLDDKTRSSKP